MKLPILSLEAREWLESRNVEARGKLESQGHRQTEKIKHIGIGSITKYIACKCGQLTVVRL